MPILHVRSVPEDLYERLKELAAEDNRSLSAQIITLLELAVEERERQRAQVRLLESIRQGRWTPPAGTPDSTRLLREDRER